MMKSQQLRETRKQQVTPLVPSFTARPSNPCDCGCIEVQTILSDNATHYASWRCTDCDRFRGWVPKPTSLTAARSEDELIDALLASGRLNNWEIGFCRSLKGQKRSPRQREKLQEIANRLGGQRKQIANPTDSHLFCAEGGEG